MPPPTCLTAPCCPPRQWAPPPPASWHPTCFPEPRGGIRVYLASGHLGNLTWEGPSPKARPSFQGPSPAPPLPLAPAQGSASQTRAQSPCLLRPPAAVASCCCCAGETAGEGGGLQNIHPMPHPFLSYSPGDPPPSSSEPPSGPRGRRGSRSCAQDPPPGPGQQAAERGQTCRRVLARAREGHPQQGLEPQEPGGQGWPGVASSREQRTGRGAGGKGAPTRQSSGMAGPGASLLRGAPSPSVRTVRMR